MKKFLSLALALVMLLGIMPMAMADGDTTAQVEYHHTAATCSGTATLGATTTPATCTATGTAAATCTECGPITATLPALGHDMQELGVEATGYVAANCKETGTMPRKCSRCDHTDTETIPATGSHTPGPDGKCTTVLHDGTTKCNETVSTALTVGDVTVSVGGTANLNVTLTPSVTGVTYTYTPADSTIATVSTAGVVTGVKKGNTTITVTASTGATATCNVTVTDGGVLSCGNTAQSTSGDSVTITPSFTLNGQSASATYAYELIGSCATLSATSGPSTMVRRTATGVVQVKVSVTGYTTSAGAAATAAELAKVAPVTVAISFYDTVDAAVTVKSGVSSFLFDDLDVFSAGTIDDTVYSKPATLCLANTYTYRGNSGSGWSNPYVTFYPTAASSAVGTISYTGLLASDFASGSRYTFSQSQDLKFSCIGKGTYTMDYVLEDGGLTLQVGTIKITVKSAESSITYKTTPGKSVTLDEKDFAAFWKAAKMSSDLSYVMFDITSTTPYYGTLYTTASTSTQKTATANMKFYYNAGTSDNYDLDAVTFAPGTKKTSYTEDIPFTCFGKTTGDKLSGIMTIKVGETVTFTDVKSGEYYYDAVIWAVENEITKGTSSTTFSPNLECDRSQVVTFLWRAAGEPEPTSSYMPFTDVDKDDFYYDAVLWAVENGITEGTSKTTFSPRMTVTRGQVVTFLWRALGEKSVSSVNPFTDVKSSEYYYNAVLWAVKNEITEGMSATSFMPNTSCTRGQIVTFLYRAYVEE